MKNCPICNAEISDELMLCENCLQQAETAEATFKKTVPLNSNSRATEPLNNNSNNSTIQKTTSLDQEKITNIFRLNKLILGILIVFILIFAYIEFGKIFFQTQETAIPEQPSLNETSKSEVVKTDKTIFISEDGVFIRHSPGTNGTTIMTAPQNMPLERIVYPASQNNGLSWIRVKLPFGDMGWVAEKFTSASKTSLPDWVKPTGRSIIRDRTNLYAYPTLKSHVISTANIGQKLIFSGRKVQNGETVWLNAETETGKECWITQESVGEYEEDLGEYALDQDLPQEDYSSSDGIEDHSTQNNKSYGSATLSGSSNLGDWRRASDVDKGRMAAQLTIVWAQTKGIQLERSTALLKAADLYACISKTAGEGEISASESTETDSQPLSDIAALCTLTMQW